MINGCVFLLFYYTVSVIIGLRKSHRGRGALGRFPYSVSVFRIPYLYVFTALGRLPYSVSVSVFRIYGFGAGSVVRIPYSVSRIPYFPYLRLWGGFRIPYPYLCLPGFGAGSVFRIHIHIPYLRLWGGARSVPIIVRNERRARSIST